MTPNVMPLRRDETTPFMPLWQDNTNKNKNTMTPNIMPLRHDNTNHKTPIVPLRQDNTNHHNKTHATSQHVRPTPDLFGDDPT